MKLGFGLGITRSRVGPHGPYVPPVPATVTRNAVRILTPGNGLGTSRVAGTGALYTYSGTYVNESGKLMDVGSLVFAGWYLSSSGTAATLNDVTVTANIEYPVGGTTTDMKISDNSTIVIPNDGLIKTDNVTLTTPIPAGATFKVNVSSTVPTGQNRLANNGLAGVLTTTTTEGLKREMLFAIGDSIMSQDQRYTVYLSATGKCPAAQCSIGGTMAQTYAPNFSGKQLQLMKMLGTTRIVCNFATNDFGAGRSLNEIKTDLASMRDAARAEGIKFTQCTNTPQSSRIGIPASSLTSSGNIATAIVPDSSSFTVGEAISIGGASPAEYSTHLVVSEIPDSTTVKFLFNGSATPTATGSNILLYMRNYGSRKHQTEKSGAYIRGSSSSRAQLNAWIRSGEFDGYLEWADEVEITRDDGLWAVGGEKPKLLAAQEIVVQSGFTNSTRFQSNYSRGSNTISGGMVIWTSGLNIGLSRTGNGNTGGDITVTGSLPNLPQVGDTAIAYPGAMTATMDGIHPSLAVGGGGQVILVDATKAWIDSLL